MREIRIDRKKSERKRRRRRRNKNRWSEVVMVGRYLSTSTLRRHNSEEEDIHYTFTTQTTESAISAAVIDDGRSRASPKSPSSPSRLSTSPSTPNHPSNAGINANANTVAMPILSRGQINQLGSETEERLMRIRMGVDVGGLPLPPRPGVLGVTRGGV
jgi:hypothetical protein